MKCELIFSEKVMVPSQDTWRVQYLITLLGQRQDLHYLGHEKETAKVTELIDSLCVN